jgi:NADPH2:quinone reductase
MMVTFGNASGPVDPIAPLKLSQGGSLFLTRPTLADYTATREDLEARSGDLLRWIAEGKLDVRIGERHPLAEAAEAHRRIESRATTGKVLLVP